MRPADSALGIFRSPGHDLCVPGRRILRPREPCIKEKYIRISLGKFSPLIFSIKTCFGHSLEVPHRGTSKEYPQHAFNGEMRKIISK